MGGCCDASRKDDNSEKTEKSPHAREKLQSKAAADPPKRVIDLPKQAFEATLIDLKTSNQAEVIRLALAVSKVSYTETLLNPTEWTERKQAFPYTQLPILETNGRQLMGSGAVLRYICQTRGMYPALTDLKAVYRCESLCEGIAVQRRDLEAGIQQGAVAQNRAYREAKSLLIELDSQVQGSSPYLIGDVLTMADLQCLDFLWAFFLSPTKRLAHGSKVPALLADSIATLLNTHPELQTALETRTI